MSWSLWDGGRTRAEVAQAAGMITAARQRLEEFDSTLSLECGFVHVLYQNALYEAMTPARRVALSRQLGEILAQVHANAAAGVASRLALLFETGRDFARNRYQTAVRR